MVVVGSGLCVLLVSDSVDDSDFRAVVVVVVVEVLVVMDGVEY